MPREITGFECIHKHSDLSLLDGYGMVEEYAKRATEINQRFLCVTDHGMMAVIPRQIKACEENGISPIFGCELYVNPMQPEVPQGQKTTDIVKGMSDEEKKKLRKSNHILAIAYSEEGYKNLVQLSSWAWINGFYRHPRVNHEQLIKRKEGIIFSSACYNGEIGGAFDEGGKDLAFDMVEKYHEMFGDNFYLEMMLLDFDKQKPYNVFLMEAHDKYGIPLTITNDCHYCLKEDSHMQRLFLMVQTGKTIEQVQQLAAENVDLFELQDENLWQKSEEELNEKWATDYSDVIPLEVFNEAKRNTVRICEKAAGVELDRSIKLPEIEDADDKLMDAMLQGLKTRNYPKTKETAKRLKEEYGLITQKEFSSYFLIQKMMTDEARRACPRLLGWGDGSEAVGPGRGSGGGSLILYLLGITDVDPIKHDLLFSRFLSPARGGKQMKLKFIGKPISYSNPIKSEPDLVDCPF